MDDRQKCFMATRSGPMSIAERIGWVTGIMVYGPEKVPHWGLKAGEAISGKSTVDENFATTKTRRYPTLQAVL